MMEEQITAILSVAFGICCVVVGGLVIKEGELAGGALLIGVGLAILTFIR